MQKHTVVVCDHIHEAGLEILQNDENINFIMAVLSVVSMVTFDISIYFIRITKIRKK